MARQNFEPADFGISMTKDDFLAQIVADFADYSHGRMSLDEMLLRPRIAQHFCDAVRQKHGYFDLPDEIILRSIMQRRENPRPP